MLFQRTTGRRAPTQEVVLWHGLTTLRLREQLKHGWKGASAEGPGARGQMHPLPGRVYGSLSREEAEHYVADPLRRRAAGTALVRIRGCDPLPDEDWVGGLLTAFRSMQLAEGVLWGRRRFFSDASALLERLQREAQAAKREEQLPSARHAMSTRWAWTLPTNERLLLFAADSHRNKSDWFGRYPDVWRDWIDDVWRQLPHRTKGSADKTTQARGDEVAFQAMMGKQALKALQRTETGRAVLDAGVQMILRGEPGFDGGLTGVHRNLSVRADCVQFIEEVERWPKPPVRKGRRAEEYQLAWLLLPPGETDQIGPDEKGREVADGIAAYRTRVRNPTWPGERSSRRYVYFVAGEAVAGLQVVEDVDRVGIVANVWTDPDFRRQGLARKLLERAQKDFVAVRHGADLSDLGAAWLRGVRR